jgi:hypothetical protein
VFDEWQDLFGAFYENDTLGVVSRFLPGKCFGMAVLGIGFWLRPLLRHDFVSICSHDYSPHCLFPYCVVVPG